MKPVSAYVRVGVAWQEVHGMSRPTTAGFSDREVNSSGLATACAGLAGWGEGSTKKQWLLLPLPSLERTVLTLPVQPVP